MNWYINKVVRARELIEKILDSKSLEEQQQIYEDELKARFWSRPLRFVLGRDTTLSLLGVPRAQRKQVDRHYQGGIVQFIEDCLDAVFGKLPLQDNYFWRVYITGRLPAELLPGVSEAA